MKPIIKISSSLPVPFGLKLSIDGFDVPNNTIQGIDVRIRPDEVITATVEFVVDELELIAEQHEEETEDSDE